MKLPWLTRVFLWWSVSTGLALPLFGDVAEKPAPRIAEAFSVTRNPGNGTLSFSRGKSKETVSFGAESGHYGLGMIFKANALPPSFQGEFKDQTILQLAFGTLKAKEAGKIAQFGAVTVVAHSIPTGRTSFPFAIPTGKESPTKDLALLLFSSPLTAREQTDEEKLKSTLFAQTGQLSVVPKGKPSLLEINVRGNKLSYRRQEMVFAIEAGLVTPFNPDEGKLSGAVDLPVYWPEGSDAEAFAAEIAAQGMGAIGQQNASRSLSGSANEGAAKPK